MLGRRKQPPPPPGADLRRLALSVTPADLGLTGDPAVWGVVMDTAMPDGWHTLVVFADGTTSLYTSAAFGIIGGGAHQVVRDAGQALLAVATARLELFAEDRDSAIPPSGGVAIRAMTSAGTRVIHAREADLGEGRHAGSPVFYAAHEVIGRLRHATGDPS